MDQIKETFIREYLSKINWYGDWSYRKIEEDMKKFLGERPSLKVDYEKDVMVNEFSGESKEITKLAKVAVIYSGEDGKYRKYEIHL